MGIYHTWIKVILFGTCKSWPDPYIVQQKAESKELGSWKSVHQDFIYTVLGKYNFT